MNLICKFFAVSLLNVVYGEEADLSLENPILRDKRVTAADCRLGFKVKKGSSVSISSSQGNCEFDLIGGTGCIVELNCDVELPGKPGNCGNSTLIISDGVGGQKDFCGKCVTGGILPHADNLKDLFVTATNTGKSKWSCKATCTSRSKLNITSGGTPLPKTVGKKEESRCVCGCPNKDDHIVGVENAKFNEFPWQAAVVLPGTRLLVCGATIINDKFILTAAHCFVDIKPGQIEVLLHAYTLDMTSKQEGTQNVTSVQEGSTRSPGYKGKAATDKEEHSLRYKVAEIIRHPLFTLAYDYDYALLRLDRKVKLISANSPTPICLPDMDEHFLDETFEGELPWIVGWGKASETGGGSTRILQKLQIPVIPLKVCQSWLKGFVTQRMICAGYEAGGKDVCTGDSGGPLILKMPNKQWQQIGISSWGEGCARDRSPGYYSRVTDNEQWIHHHASTHGAKWCRTKTNK